MKQIHMLINIDNIERKQIAWVSAKVKDVDVICSVLQQQPFVKEMLAIQKPLYPSSPHLQLNIFDWDGKAADIKSIKVAPYAINDEIARFYGLRMKEGTSSFELGENEVFINETLAKEMNVENPVGKVLDKRYRIKGIIYDYQIQAPNAPLIPIYYSSPGFAPKSHVAFKYDGDWKTCVGTLEKEIRKKGVQGRLSLEDGEEYYQYYLKSEFNLLKLLGVITVVSILIAIFGIYALIMQSCDQHRKEIAIRKVHGAGVMDILMMFFKQYMMQVVVAAAIAFPIGYVLMKNWLEQYARQTSISLWIYLCIFLGISLLVTLCIGWRVWKAANENPAWVIKKE
jgi:ABC-type lipoprotein release transport system permease subunit